MASQYIDIGTSTRQSSDVRSAIDQCQSTLDRFAEIKSWFDQAAQGEDWTSLGALLGLSAADAQVVYNLWTSANIALHGSDVTTLLAHCA